MNWRNSAHPIEKDFFRTDDGRIFFKEAEAIEYVKNFDHQAGIERKRGYRQVSSASVSSEGRVTFSHEFIANDGKSFGSEAEVQKYVESMRK